MSWLLDLYQTQPVAHAILALAMVCVAGMALGSLRIRGIGLGTAGVLFAGIIAGHFGKAVDHATLDFVKEFGLILFVFTIGLQLGPGFLAALRQQGMKLNLLAAAVVVLGALTALFLGWLLGIEPAAVLGLLSGGTTNTPSLGAATQALAALPQVTRDQAALPALAYAVSYPAAITGIIGTLLALKVVFRIDPAVEVDQFVRDQRSDLEPVERRTILVENPNFGGVAVQNVCGPVEMDLTISRIRKAGTAVVLPATGDTLLAPGDCLCAVGTPAMLDQFQRSVGRVIEEDLVEAPGETTYRRVVVTNREVLGKTVRELALDHRHGVVVTRVTRADLVLTAVPSLKLQYGDMLQVVGTGEGIDRAAAYLGNSVKELGETHFIPLFLGITFGIVLGTMPISFLGLPQPIRLGLAGGPLIVALLLGRLGRIGKLVFYMPVNSNLAFREFGIALFFAAVGLNAGTKFFDTVFSSTGALWLVAGIGITLVPIVTVGLFARAVLKMNFMTLSGLLSGSMTDPPALAFASNIARSDAPTVAYATVYPLTTLLRILSAQVLALVLFR